MPLMILNNRTADFSMYDANLLPQMLNFIGFKRWCWGWGVIKYEPKKFYRERTVNNKKAKYLAVRSWVDLSCGRGDPQEIRIDITDEYAEGCQYLMPGDPIWFCGEVKYDGKYSEIKGFPFFIIKADMVIPPYSADGREFCARKNAIVERRNEQMLSDLMQSGQKTPNMDDLGRYLEKEK